MGNRIFVLNTTLVASRTVTAFALFYKLSNAGISVEFILLIEINIVRPILENRCTVTGGTIVEIVRAGGARFYAYMPAVCGVVIIVFFRNFKLFLDLNAALFLFTSSQLRSSRHNIVVHFAATNS